MDLYQDDATTGKKGIVRLALPNETAAGLAVQASDIRTQFTSNSYESNLFFYESGSGQYYPVYAHGIFSSIGGINDNGLDSTHGPYGVYSTGTTSGDYNGDIFQVDAIQRKYNPRLYYKFKLEQTTLCRLYIGFSTGLDNTNPTYSTGDDWLNGKSGFMLYVTSGGNFRIGYNDGTGATNFTSDLAAIDTNVHTVYLEADDATTRWGYSFDNAAITWITSNIPAQTTGMSFVHEIETNTTESKLFRFYNIKFNMVIP